MHLRKMYPPKGAQRHTLAATTSGDLFWMLLVTEKQYFPSSWAHYGVMYVLHRSTYPSDCTLLYWQERTQRRSRTGV